MHVEVSDQIELANLLGYLQANNLPVAWFEESYDDWGLTAVSVLLSGPELQFREERKVLRKLKLWKPRPAEDAQ